MRIKKIVLSLFRNSIINQQFNIMKSYSELKNQQPELFECFFAFSNDQFNEGIKKNNLEDKKILRAPGGLFGTKEGIKKLYADYDNIRDQVSMECDPQECYEYEFNNHECGYTHDDEEAIKIVVSYFGEEKAKTVKRHNGCAYVNIDELKFNI